MHVRDYERPDGWSKGAPDVLVAQRVGDILGMPLVDYDSLHQHMTDELGIPYDHPVAIKLYGRFLPGLQRPVPRAGVVGFHVPFTRTVHANALRAERGLSRAGGTMSVISHEGRHLSDSANHKIRSTAELGVKAVALFGGQKLLKATGVDPITTMAATTVGAGAYYKYIDPMEKRANATQEAPSSIAHEQDILFPNSDRTAFLRLTNQLSDETLERLGDLAQ